MSPRRSTFVSLAGPAANGLVRAILEADLVGVALLRGPGHVHVLANAKYERLVGADESTYGRPLRDVLAVSSIPEVVLAGVLHGSGAATAREVVCERRGQNGRFGTHYATFTFSRVEGELDSILVLADDVTELVRARRRADLFVTLTAELLPSLHPRAAVRSVVTHIAHALGAKASSVFVMGRNGASLLGAMGEWDWTRSSFEVRLRDWPTVSAALTTGHARYLTAQDARGAEVGWFETRGTVGALCVPLRASDRAVGMLFFDFDDARAPSMASVDFAENVAAHCAAVLERAVATPELPSATV